MPELPEVNTFQRYFDGTSLHQRIESVEVQDDKIIRNVSGEEFIDKLTGRTFVGSYRRGKYLFAKLDNDQHVLLHFGMTGDLNYYSEPEERTRHERFVFHFENGQHLGFDCPRKFAKIRYIEDLELYLQDIKLGEDALVISEEDFLQKMEGKTATIKGFLLNQAQVAGVGNLYADEICYQTKIHPGSRSNNLNLQQKQAIYQAMKNILQEAIDRNAYYKEYPENWFWEWRKEDRPGPDGEGMVRRTKIAGRTTYFIEGVQVLY
jgi:formamidopyrimidine-DNA glycosylase